MSKHTIDIVNEINTLTDTIKKYGSKGFLFRYEGFNYIITVHHFMPILTSYLNFEDIQIKLNKSKNIYWNELNILEAPLPNKSNKIITNFYKNKISIKSYKTRFPETNSTITIEINNKFERYPLYGHEYLQDEYSDIESIYLKFYICKYLNPAMIKKYQGFSGSPVYSSDNNLVGVFCSVSVDKNNNLFGLFLPTIYIIKSLQKIDNEHIYKLDIKHDTDLKIGNFEIQKNVHSLHNHQKNDYVIYHFATNFKLTINAFFNLEGDENKSISIKNNKTNETTSVTYEKRNNFDININILKNEDKFKVNNGFTTLLSKNNYDKQLEEMHNKYTNKEDLWLSLKELSIN